MILKLPTVLFESLADLHEITAVYLALAESGKVLYIGYRFGQEANSKDCSASVGR
jgi:hypothetical protein